MRVHEYHSLGSLPDVHSDPLHVFLGAIGGAEPGFRGIQMRVAPSSPPRPLAIHVPERAPRFLRCAVPFLTWTRRWVPPPCSCVAPWRCAGMFPLLVGPELSVHQGCCAEEPQDVPGGSGVARQLRQFVSGRLGADDEAAVLRVQGLALGTSGQLDAQRVLRRCGQSVQVLVAWKQRAFIPLSAPG